MRTTWTEAGGEHQFPYIGAASRALQGERDILCPKCHIGILRCYFHVFNHKQMTGTIWVWCHHCHTTAHLPRVKPASGYLFPDPFQALSLEQFAELKQDTTERFFDRLERLWESGQLGFPEGYPDKL